MPKRIVPGFLISETCPAPECNLSEHDVEQFVAELETYFDLFGACVSSSRSIWVG
jgi:hypothetical protein